MHSRTERRFYFRLIQIGVAEESKAKLFLFSLLIKFSETHLTMTVKSVEKTQCENEGLKV